MERLENNVSPSIDINLVNYELVIHELQEEYDRKSNEVRVYQLTLRENEYGKVNLQTFYRRWKIMLSDFLTTNIYHILQNSMSISTLCLSMVFQLQKYVIIQKFKKIKTLQLTIYIFFFNSYIMTLNM